ncbi:MAG: hypothetical protein F6K35_36000 [Okeania sp. SIO2H7]|nr:hypothetical protein [Okeania sp. SIO2H7]
MKNPDKLSRPPNSPQTVYQIEENALELRRVTVGRNDFGNYGQFKHGPKPLAKSLEHQEKWRKFPLVKGLKICVKKC